MTEELPRSRRVDAGKRAGRPGPLLSRHISRVAGIIDAAPIAAAVWSLDGELVHANPVFRDLFGQRDEDLAGRRIVGFIDPGDAPGVHQALDDLFEGRRNHFRLDLVGHRPDGTRSRLESFLTPIYGSTGRPEYLVSQVFDFTGLPPDVSSTERLANDAPAMLWLTDDQGIPRVGNRASYAFLGESPLSGDLREGLFDHLDMEDFAEIEDELMGRLTQRAPIEFVARSRRHDGEWRSLLHRALPMFGAGGRFEGYAGVSLDITDRERALHRLTELERLFETVTEAGPVAVARLDAEGRIVYMNDRWSDVLDEPELQLHGFNWTQLLGDDQVRGIVELGLESVETRRGFKLRVATTASARLMVDPEHHVPGMRYWAELRVVPVYLDDGGHDGWVASLTDVSAEIAAGSRADRLARVLDAGSDFLMIAERNGVISYVNNAAATVLGVRAADGASVPGFLMDVLDATSYELYHDVVEPALNTEGLWRGELAFRTATEGTIPVSALFLAHPNPHGHIESVSAVARDISDLKAAQAKLQQMATHDYLTGLPNRVLLYDRLEQALARWHRYRHPVALLYLDLDGFKSVNDELGHHVGDVLLTRIADRIHSVIRDADTAARIGGDEFCLLVEGIADVDTLEVVANRLIATISEPVEIGGASAQVGTSIGLVVVDDRVSDADELMALADKAMYRAKADGRGRCVVHEAGNDR
jgi:diguanylate cyclase (GGDEF)-like protein/PAS domain S-box-containing protein